MIVENQSDAGAGGSLAPGTASARNLTRRIVSACILAPVALAATYLGGWAFAALCLVAAGAVLWEWASLRGPRPDPGILACGLPVLVLGAFLAGQGENQLAIAVIIAGAILAAAVPLVPWYRAALSPGWGAGGMTYAGYRPALPGFPAQ